VNAVQEAIARVTGLDDVVESQNSELQEIANVLESVVSDNQLLQRQIEDLDYLNLFDMNQVEEILPIRDRKKVLARLRRLRHDNPLAKQAVKLIIRFTLGKGVQWILASEPPEPDDGTDGNQFPGADVLPFENKVGSSSPPPPPTRLVQISRAARSRQEQVLLDQSDPTRDILEAFWNDDENKLAFTTHKSMQQMLDDIVTDGEKFYGCFEGTIEPYVKVSEFPIEEITNIIYHPDNRLKPVFYRRSYMDTEYDGKAEMIKPIGNPKVVYYWDYRIKEEEYPDILKKVKVPKSKIGEAKVRHVMINELWTKSGKRGLSELYASREWFRVFREFMEGRAAINAAAQAISYLRKIKGSPSTVARFSGQLGGLPMGQNAGDTTDVRRLTRPAAGAIYDSNDAVDLEWMKTDTGAVNAKEDAKLILTTGGAGVGTMAHYFGEGGDANLATAQSMELPMVKTYEDWQQFIDDFFKGWFYYVLTVATDDEKQASEDLQRIGFTFPPIISQDVVKYTTSWSQIVRDIAPNNMAVKRQAIRSVLSVMQVPNIDAMMPEIEAEMAKAEAMRVQQQQQMAQLAAQADNPVAGNTPNAGVDPNMKHLIAGKGIKEANGPKSA